MSPMIVSEVKEYIEELLKDLGNKGYFFHNIDHTLDVFDRATYLSQKEGINKELIELIQIAALFHDAGFVHQYDDNELLGFELMEQYLNSKVWIFNDRKNFPSLLDSFLKNNKYPDDEFDLIKQLIQATIPFSRPKNILEEIMKDADVDNFGRSDFFDKGVLLRKEFQVIKKIIFTEKEWLDYVYDLFQKLKFYTKTQIKERQDKFLENQKIVEDKLAALNNT